jgi:hypothetical protein
MPTAYEEALKLTIEHMKHTVGPMKLYNTDAPKEREGDG